MTTTTQSAAPGRVAIIGSGTMGVGIAACFARAGAQVTLTARSAASLARGRGRAEAVAATLEAHAQLGASLAAEHVVARLAWTTDTAEAVAGADLVVESIAEDLEAKSALLAALSAQAPRGALLTTNTSSLPLDALAQAVRDPSRFAALHWFNPPELVPLVEVVAAGATSARTMDQLLRWAQAAGKRPVRVERALPGFVANRLQYALVREAYALVAAGACSYEAVDLAVTSCLGPRWAAVGPIQSMDLAGLDVHLAVAEQLFGQLARDTDPPAALRRAVQSGALGTKNGRGLLGEYAPEDVAALVKRRAAMLVEAARAS